MIPAGPDELSSEWVTASLRAAGVIGSSAVTTLHADIIGDDALLDAANVYPASASRGFAEPERAVEADPEADRLPASAPAAGVAVPHELDAGLIESIDLDALIDAASAYPALPAAGDFDAPLSEAGAGARIAA